MNKTIEPWEHYSASKNDFDPSDDNYQSSRKGKLLYEVLKLSPSIETASLYINNQLDRYKDREYIPSDLDAVVEAYKNLGLNEHTLSNFKSWWNHHGAYVFGEPPTSPELVPLLTIFANQEINQNECLSIIDSYAKDKSLETVSENTAVMLLAIPLKGDKKRIMKRFEDILNSQTIQPMRIEDPSAILVGKRFVAEPIRKRLRVLWMKGLSPNMVIHELGAEAGISDKYPNWETLATAIANSTETDPSNSMRTATLRSLREAVNTVENAARGRFPCHDSVNMPGDYKHDIVLKHIIANIQMKKNLKERLMKFKIESTLSN
ncbi:MAG: hypothetical protein NTY69_09960 [Methylococcales bacterium]|nr:hypothetical protein [Methylococcales bacterium]